MLHLFLRNWFLFGIVVCILAAEVFPHLGKTGGLLAPEWTAKYLAVSLIFFLSGLSLSINDFTRAARKSSVLIFTQLFTFLIIPVFMYSLVLMLRHFTYINEWILKGLVTVACMPPPVSSAVILTKAVGGNEAAAVFNSVIGSFLGVLITPISLIYFLGVTALVSTLNTVIVLSITVVFPLLIGLFVKHLQLIPNTSKIPTSAIGQSLLMFIIYTAFCDAFITYDSPMSPIDILSSIVLVILRTYAPYITLPFAAVVGVIGYNLESILSDKHTPYQDSIENKRRERLLEGETVAEGSLKEKKFVPTTILDRNLSPSLKNP